MGRSEHRPSRSPAPSSPRLEQKQGNGRTGSLEGTGPRCSLARDARQASGSGSPFPVPVHAPRARRKATNKAAAFPRKKRNKSATLRAGAQSDSHFFFSQPELLPEFHYCLTGESNEITAVFLVQVCQASTYSRMATHQRVGLQLTRGSTFSEGV